jgi:hypothetical protein
MLRVKAALVCVVLCMSQQASALEFFLGGNALHRTCQNPTQRGTTAKGFIIGVEDLNSYLTDINVIKKSSCTSKEVDAEQITDTACNYLRDNPQHRHHPAVHLVREAMTKAFPCKP